MHEILFWIIIGILVLDFLFEKYLDYLNTTQWSDTLPDAVRGIYDEEKYRKQQSYERENHRLGMVSDSFSTAVMLSMFLLGGFAMVNGWVWSATSSAILAALFFFGILMFASDLIGIPFEIYAVFRIEEKYGFNKTTPGIFIFDKLKGWLVGALMGGGLLALIVFIYQLTGQWFWLLAWGVISLFTVFMTMFYSNLIVPLFNKQTPLEEGELRNAISAFAEKVGFKLDNIFVIDGSKRSTKANAYFTGLGAKKRIVLYDTLIKEMTTEEIVAVLAHEIGHNKKKHVVQSLLIGLIQTGVVLFILGLFINNPHLSRALGVEQPNFHIGLVAFGVLYTPISFVTGIFMNLLSRRNEYQADRYAAENYKPEALASALKKLSVNNLSNLTPHKLYVFFHYSHPTLLQRLAFLKTFEKK